MAIITHSTSKNADYSDVYNYYKFKHKEDPDTGRYEPIYDELGFLQERDNYAMTYIDPLGNETPPEQWEGACRRTNLVFGKNKKFNERKNHEYIISHPEEDRPNMTMEDLLEEGRAFARENLLGYDAIIAVHRDTDNDHIHITINSVRALEREEQPWMLRDEDGNVLPCEIMAGGKHQDSPGFRYHYNDWLLDYTRSHGWVEKDNNAIAKARKDERKASKKQPDTLKDILLSAAEEASSLDEFRECLSRHQVKLQIRGKTISVIPEGAQKAIRLRTLGLDADELMRMINGISPEEWLQESSVTQQVTQDAQWLRDRRSKNSKQAEEAITAAEAVLENAVEHDDYNEVIDQLALKRAIQKNLYAQRDLQTERDKFDRLLNRWDDYHQTNDSKEKTQLGKYIQYCGFNPDEQAGYDELSAMRDMTMQAIDNLTLQHEALSKYAPAPVPDDSDVIPDQRSILVHDNVSDIPDRISSTHTKGDTWWTDEYKYARKVRYGNKKESIAADPEKAYQLLEVESAKGNGLAMHDLADMNQRGHGCEINEDLATQYYQNALNAFLEKVQTEKNPAYLQYRIGKMYLRGLGTEQDYRTAAHWLSLAVSGEKPNPYAAYSLAGMYRRGQGVEADNTEAFRLYEMAADHNDAGNAYANYEVAKMLQSGIGTAPDPQEADQRFAMAYSGFLELEESSLDENLLYRIGQMNYEGKGTEKNFDTAVSYFERAAKLKNSNALFGLGKIYLDKNYDKYEPEKGIEYLKEASKLGNVFAQTRLGKAYMTGEHVPCNLDTAIQLFKAAAQEKNSIAQYHLGKIYYAPIDGRPQDLHQAVWYLELSAASNNAQAQTLLGKILLKEEQYLNKHRGMELLRKAAEQNNPEAQYQLGKILHYSREPQAQPAALQYLESAVAQEYAPAMVLLGKILINEPSGAQMERGIDLMLSGRSEEDFSAKELLKEIRSSRKKLGQIAYNCQRAANRRIYNQDYLEKAERYRQLWHVKLQQEKLLKNKIKQENKEAKQNRRDVRRQPNEKSRPVKTR